jgi:hypothetical protein
MHLSQYYTPAPMAEVIMQAIDHWFSNLQLNLVPQLPTGHDDPNLCLHQLINEAFATKTTLDGDIFYEAAFHSSASYALLSTISIISQVTCTTHTYG